MQSQEKQEAVDVAEVDAVMTADHNDDQAVPEAKSNINDAPIQAETASNATHALPSEELLRIRANREAAILRRDARASAAAPVDNLEPTQELRTDDSDAAGGVVSADNVEPTQELSADDIDVSDDEAEADHNLSDRSRCLVCLDVLPLQADGEDLTTLSCQHTFHSYCLQSWANIQGCHAADVRCPGRCVVDRQAAAASQVEVMAPESVLCLMAMLS